MWSPLAFTTCEWWLHGEERAGGREETGEGRDAKVNVRKSSTDTNAKIR